MEKPTYKDYIALFNYKPHLWWLAAAGSLLILASLFVSPLASLWALCALCLFDCVGYWFEIKEGRDNFSDVISQMNNLGPSYRTLVQMENYSFGLRRMLPAYRIIQAMFLVALAALITAAYGWQPGVAFVVLWWTGNQDLLYYFGLGEPLPGAWTWLGWTPLGWITPKTGTPVQPDTFEKRLSPLQVYVQAAVGVVVAVAVIVYGQTALDAIIHWIMLGVV